MDDPEGRARASLRRSLLLYTALLAVDALVVAYIVTNSAGGAAFVTLSIVALVGVLLAYQVVQHVRDLRASLAESDGVVARKWQRADMIVVMQSFYVTVDRMVFRLRPEDYVLIDEGMYVKVVHFPNTLGVVTIHEIRRPPSAQNVGGA